MRLVDADLRTEVLQLNSILHQFLLNLTSELQLLNRCIFCKHRTFVQIITTLN